LGALSFAGSHRGSHNARARIGRCFDLARSIEIHPYSTGKTSEKNSWL